MSEWMDVRHSAPCPTHTKHSIPNGVNGVILGSNFPVPLHSQLP